MPARKSQQNRKSITYESACDLVEAALAGNVRTEILDALESGGDFSRACDGLRSAMRSHIFPTRGEPLALNRAVQSLDGRAQRGGLHVLESWDYRAHRFADDILPVLMLDRSARGIVPLDRRRATLAGLLDNYFFSILGLFAAQAWDEGDPNANLDRVNRLLDLLHKDSPNARFVDDAETLLLVAVSHYHPVESAYDDLLAKIATLNDAHRLRFAFAGVAALGGHLRWGLRFMYRRDVGRMRDDNVVDYPWLVFSLVTLWRELRRLRDANITGPEREHVAEALVNGIAADPWLWTGSAPACLGSFRAEHAEMREDMFENHELLFEALEVLRPAPGSYSPLGFDCNFVCNTMVAMVATALAEPGPHPSLNTLVSRGGDDAERYARRLMAYARAGAASPDTPALIIYDPREAAHSFNVTAAVLREALENRRRDAGATSSSSDHASASHV